MSEYLSMAQLVQSKIDNYKDFPDHAQRNLQINALEAWKHRKQSKKEIPDLPDGARLAHSVPFKQLCNIVLSAITNVEVKNQVGTILQEAEKFTMSDAPAPAPAPNQVDYDNIGGMSTPARSLDGGGAFEYAMDDEDEFIPQWCPPTPPVQPQDMPDDLFETPCLKKMRIHGKQPDPNRPNKRSPETIPIDSSIDDESEDENNITKAEIRAKKIVRDRLGNRVRKLLQRTSQLLRKLVPGKA